MCLIENILRIKNTFSVHHPIYGRNKANIEGHLSLFVSKEKKIGKKEFEHFDDLYDKTSFFLHCRASLLVIG